MSRLRFAVTTSVDRALEVAAHVDAGGFEAVMLPCIEVVPAPVTTLDEARKAAGQVDWLVVTSPRAVTTLWPEGEMPRVQLAAVGPGTAQAAEMAGGSVAVVGEGGAEAMLDRLGGSLEGKRVLFPHGANAEPSTLRRLGASAARVTAIAVYETRSIPPGPHPVDVALFASPSAVRGWVLSRELDDVVRAAIGTTTAAMLEELRRPPQVTSPRPEYPILIETVARYLRDRRLV